MRRRGSGAKLLMAALFTTFLWAGITAGPSVVAAKNLTDMGYTLTDLNLGGSYSQVFAINDKGEVVGWSRTAGNLAQHAFLYSKGTMTDLTQVVSDLFLVDFFNPIDINPAGEIIGTGGNGDAYILKVP